MINLPNKPQEVTSYIYPKLQLVCRIVFLHLCSQYVRGGRAENFGMSCFPGVLDRCKADLIGGHPSV